MSENNNEQMDLGNGAINNNDENNGNDVADRPTNNAHSEVTANENTIPQLKLTIKTPKEKKDISIEESSTIKQVNKNNN